MQVLPDGPYFMFRPDRPDDGAGFAKINTSTVDPATRIVSDGQRVWALENLLATGHIFIPIVYIDKGRYGALETLIELAEYDLNEGYRRDTALQTAVDIMKTMMASIPPPERTDDEGR